MKTKVVTEPKFIVKPENKVVICNMRVDMQLRVSEIWPIIKEEWWGTKAPKVNYFGGFVVTAKARCNSVDTFDETIGKRIAESRAKAKAFKIAKNVWNRIAEELYNNSKLAEERAKNCKIVEEVELKHVKELVK
jgi:hypothetical protein|nr:MAG TPA: hypothetical protein [Crassvirales sp.]